MPAIDHPIATLPYESTSKLQKQWGEQSPVLVQWKMQKPKATHILLSSFSSHSCILLSMWVATALNRKVVLTCQLEWSGQAIKYSTTAETTAVLGATEITSSKAYHVSQCNCRGAGPL